MKTLGVASSAILLAVSQFAFAQSGSDSQTITDPSVLGQPQILQTTPVYRDGVLTIPEGTLVDESGAHAFRDIVLLEEDDGRFTLVASDDGVLAYVEDITIESNDENTDTLLVTVVGNTPTPCMHLLPPSISVEGNNIMVVLPVSRPTEDACVQVLEPFETNFTVPTSELDAGEYTLIINGEEATFIVD